MSSSAAAIEATRDALVADGAVLCVRLGEGAPVLDACRAALAGGLRVFEVTLTTPGALDVIAALAREGGALAGAGTVLAAEDVKAVADAGGRFVFSPVFDRVVLEEAERHGLLAVPGAATPSEIFSAHRHGARIVKVFPAAALGGPAYLRAVRGPLPRVPLLPTNGPTAANLGEYLAAGAVAVGIGAEVFPAGLAPAAIEAAARRVRRALDAARAGAAAPAAAAGSGAAVDVTPMCDGLVQGVACRWQGGQYVALVAPHGLVACGILDPAVCERFGFAVALAHGTPEAPLVRPEDVLAARVDRVTPAAEARGIRAGMTGAEALERLL